MADFTNSTIQTAASPFTPTQPSVDRSVGGVVDVFSNLAGGAIQALGQKQQKDQEVKAASYIQDFREEQLLISEAVEQGRLTSDQGVSRLRSNLLRYTSNNPMLAEEIQKVHSDLISMAGLGKEVVEGSVEEQAFDKVRADAISNGWVKEGATPEEVQDGVRLYLDDKAAQAQLSRAQAEVSLQSSRLGVRSSEMSIERNRVQLEAQRALTSLAGTQTPRFRNEMNRLVADVQQGRITREEAITLAQDQMATVNTFISQVGVDAGEGYITALASPIKMVFDNTMKHLNGELSAELLTRSNDVAMATATAGWLESPERARIVAGSRLFPNSDIIQLEAQVAPTITSYLRGYNSDRGLMTPFPLEDTEKQGYQSYLNSVLTPNIQLMLNNNLDEETEVELDKNIGNMIKSIPAYSGTTDGLGDYRQVVDFLADPTVFGRYVEKRGGIPSDAANNAYRVLQENYETEVVDLIKEEYVQNVAQIANFLPTTGPTDLIGKMVIDGKEVPDIIEPHFSGGGVSFRVKPGIPPNTEYNRILRTLNSRVSPALNKLIHLGAHFNGNRDYKGIYDANYSDLFGVEQQAAEE